MDSWSVHLPRCRPISRRTDNLQPQKRLPRPRQWRRHPIHVRPRPSVRPELDKEGGKRRSGAIAQILNKLQQSSAFPSPGAGGVVVSRRMATKIGGTERALKLPSHSVGGFGIPTWCSSLVVTTLSDKSPFRLKQMNGQWI